MKREALVQRSRATRSVLKAGSGGLFSEDTDSSIRFMQTKAVGEPQEHGSAQPSSNRVLARHTEGVNVRPLRKPEMETIKGRKRIWRRLRNLSEQGGDSGK